MLGHENEHKREIFSGSAISLGVKSLGAVLSFAVNVVIARLLGPELAGLYFLALTTVVVASAFARLGLDNGVIRFIGIASSSSDYGLVKGIYYSGIKLCVVAAVLVTLAIYFMSDWLSEDVFSNPELSQPIKIMSLAIIPFSLFTIHAQCLRGLKRVGSSALVLNFLQPLGSLLLFPILIPKWGLAGAVIGYFISTVFTLICGIFIWRLYLQKLNSKFDHFSVKKLLLSSMPLYVVALMQVGLMWSGNLMLGMWADSSEVAIFSVANRVAMLISFIFVAVNSISLSKFAALYSKGDINGLATSVRFATRLTLFVAIPVLIVTLLFVDSILYIFGEEFVVGVNTLSILAVGYFLNQVPGSSGSVLMMCGYGKYMRDTLGVCLLMNIILNYLLIPSYGSLGAAVSTALALFVHPILCAYFVRVKIGISTFPLGKNIYKNIIESKSKEVL